MIDERANEVAALAGLSPRRSGVENQSFFAGGRVHGPRWAEVRSARTSRAEAE
jgi:hypothetical protein